MDANRLNANRYYTLSSRVLLVALGCCLLQAGCSHPVMNRFSQAMPLKRSARAENPFAQYPHGDPLAAQTGHPDARAGRAMPSSGKASAGKLASAKTVQPPSETMSPGDPTARTASVNPRDAAQALQQRRLELPSYASIAEELAMADQESSALPLPPRREVPRAVENPSFEETEAITPAMAAASLRNRQVKLATPDETDETNRFAALSSFESPEDIAENDRTQRLASAITGRSRSLIAEDDLPAEFTSTAVSTTTATSTNLAGSTVTPKAIATAETFSTINRVASEPKATGASSTISSASSSQLGFTPFDAFEEDAGTRGSAAGSALGSNSASDKASSLRWRNQEPEVDTTPGQMTNYNASSGTRTAASSSGVTSSNTVTSGSNASGNSAPASTLRFNPLRN